VRRIRVTHSITCATAKAPGDDYNAAIAGAEEWYRKYWDSKLVIRNMTPEENKALTEFCMAELGEPIPLSEQVAELEKDLETCLSVAGELLATILLPQNRPYMPADLVKMAEYRNEEFVKLKGRKPCRS
jgi:hypothetical protein